MGFVVCRYTHCSPRSSSSRFLTCSVHLTAHSSQRTCPSTSRRPASTPPSDTIALLQPLHAPGPIIPCGCLVPGLAVAHSRPSWRSTSISLARGGRCLQTFLTLASGGSSSLSSAGASWVVHAVDPAQLGHTPAQLGWSFLLVFAVPLPQHVSHTGRPPLVLSTPNHPVAPRRLGRTGGRVLMNRWSCVVNSPFAIPCSAFVTSSATTDLQDTREDTRTPICQW